MINQRLYGGAWSRFFTAPPPETKQATLIVAPGERYFAENDAGAVLLHQFYRFFSPSRHSGYAKKFTRVTVIPKVDAVGVIKSRTFGAQWSELERISGAEDKLQTGGVADSSSFTLRVREVRTHVLVLVEAPSDLAEVGRMSLVNQAGRHLPVMRAQRADGLVALVGLTSVGDESVELVDCTVNVKRRCPWKIVQARQQSRGEPVLAWFLPEAFHAPEAFFPDAFRGCWQADSGVYGSLFRDAARPAAGRAVEREDRVVFDDSRPAALLESRLIPIDPAAQRYLRIDWRAGGRSPAVLITDPDGRRLLELPPPVMPGVRDYVVPMTPGWSSLRVMFRSEGGTDVVLPRSVQLVQAAPLPALRVPVAALFLTSFPNPTHVERSQ
ncbi:MAG: hypothetical protein QM760_03845 [Nibricoccus sp.]